MGMGGATKGLTEKPLFTPLPDTVGAILVGSSFDGGCPVLGSVSEKKRGGGPFWAQRIDRGPMLGDGRTYVLLGVKESNKIEIICLLSFFFLLPPQPGNQPTITYRGMLATGGRGVSIGDTVLPLIHCFS